MAAGVVGEDTDHGEILIRSCLKINHGFRMTAKVAGEDTGHDVLPWLLSSPTAKESNYFFFSLSHPGISEAFFLCFLCASDQL